MTRAIGRLCRNCEPTSDRRIVRLSRAHCSQEACELASRQTPDRIAPCGHPVFVGWCPGAAGCCSLRSKLRSHDSYPTFGADDPDEQVSAHPHPLPQSPRRRPPRHPRLSHPPRPKPARTRRHTASPRTRTVGLNTTHTANNLCTEYAHTNSLAHSPGSQSSAIIVCTLYVRVVFLVAIFPSPSPGPHLTWYAIVIS